MNRGDVWAINSGERIGTRPVVILTRQNVLKYLNKVTVAEITTKGKGYPTEIFIDQKANLSKPSFVRADNLHTVPKNRLERYLGSLDPDTMRKVSHKLILLLNWKAVCLKPKPAKPVEAKRKSRFTGEMNIDYCQSRKKSEYSSPDSIAC